MDQHNQSLEQELTAILGPLGVQLEGGEQEPSPALSPEAPMRPSALPPGMINQVWFCERCYVVDVAQISTSADYYEAVKAIRAAHQAKMPHCHETNGLAFIQVINPTVATSRAVLVDAEEVPEWAIDGIAHLLGLSY